MRYNIEEATHSNGSTFRVQYEHTTFFRKRKVWKYFCESYKSGIPKIFFKYEDAEFFIKELKFKTKIINHLIE